MPIARSSSLSRSKARRNAVLSSGYSSCAWISDAGERSPGVEQERGQVEEPLQLLPRHVPTLPDRGCSAASAPAAAVARKNSGSSSGPRPIVVTWRPSAARSAGTSGPATTRTSWRSCSKAPSLGRRDQHRRAGEVERGARVVAHALVARPGVAVGHAQHRDRVPAERGGGVEDAGHLERGGAERRRVPTTPGPIATMATSAWATWRARARADGTDTASRSPPNAWPAVMVTSMSPALVTACDEVGDGERQRGAVGHHVGDARASGWASLDGRRHARHLAVQAARPPPACPPRSVSDACAVLLGGAGVDLEARVAELHDVARARAPRAPRARCSSARRASRRCRGRARRRWC